MAGMMRDDDRDPMLGAPRVTRPAQADDVGIAPAARAPGARLHETHARRRSPLAWLIPLALLLLVGAAFFRSRDRNDEVATTLTATTTASGGEVGLADTATHGVIGGAPNGEALPLAGIAATPGDYATRTVTGTATVAEVVSDRGFWLQSAGGQRLFVVLGEKGAGTNAAEHHTDIKSGQTLHLANAHVYTQASQVPGAKLEAKALKAIEGQPAFLHVNPGDVHPQGATAGAAH